jgi:hypothetical protein
MLDHFAVEGDPADGMDSVAHEVVVQGTAALEGEDAFVEGPAASWASTFPCTGSLGFQIVSRPRLTSASDVVPVGLPPRKRGSDMAR